MIEKKFILWFTCGWYKLNEFALCNGISTRSRNTLCSSLSGTAKPLIILEKNKYINKDVWWILNKYLPSISSNSAIPLNRSYS